MVYLTVKFSSTLEQYQFKSKSMQDIKKHQNKKAVLRNTRRQCYGIAVPKHNLDHGEH